MFIEEAISTTYAMTVIHDETREMSTQISF